MTPIPVHAANPGPMTGDGNWTWLLRGRIPTLIDAGTGETRHLDAVEAALAGAALAQVLVTHGHVDHASGAPALAARFPNARFLKMPWPERDDSWPVAWEPIAAGQWIDAGDTRLEAIHTPGHAPDHLCFWHGESRTLFGGDLAVQGTTVYIPASLEGDLIQYLESLERVRTLGSARVLPAHGPVIDDPDTLLQEYLAHRRQREEQIVASLAVSDVTVEALVPLVYRGIQEKLRQVARETVLAHLVKLEREGRAGRRGEAWHIMKP